MVTMYLVAHEAELDWFLRTHFVVDPVVLKIPLGGMIWWDVDEEDKHYLFLNCDRQVIHKNTTFPATWSPVPARRPAVSYRLRWFV